MSEHMNQKQDTTTKPGKPSGKDAALNLTSRTRTTLLIDPSSVTTRKSKRQAAKASKAILEKEEETIRTQTARLE